MQHEKERMCGVWHEKNAALGAWGFLRLGLQNIAHVWTFMGRMVQPNQLYTLRVPWRFSLD